MDCIFCKIVNGDIPSKKAYEDDKVLVFYDIEPQAPVHLVAIPKAHIQSANDITAENADLIGYIFTVIAKLAKELDFADNGYRIVNNCGTDGGQTVEHLHFHIMAGRPMGWPAG